MDMILYFVIIFAVIILFVTHEALRHKPNQELTPDDINQIKKLGLYHSTDELAAKQIIKNGFRGKISSPAKGIKCKLISNIINKSEAKLGEITWFYIASPENCLKAKKSKRLKNKKVLLHVTINEHDLKNMLKRKSDGAIVFCGKHYQSECVKIINN